MKWIPAFLPNSGTPLQIPPVPLPITKSQADAASVGVIAALKEWFAPQVQQSPDQSGISADAHLSWVKINSILNTGLQGIGDTNVYDFAAVSGTQGAVPFYQTYALTFRTTVRRGRARTGRIFPPMVAFPVGTDGHCATASATGAAKKFEECVLAMLVALGGAMTPGSFAVLSPGDTTKGTFPIANIFSSVVMDTVPDVQHRRTNRLARIEGLPRTFSTG